MVDAVVITDSRAVAAVSERAELSRTGEVLRDIARGGISGVLVGVVVGGLGGRIVMRVVAILHPDAVGAVTENGNRIGDITVGGTLLLVLFGLISCAIAGTLWVIVSPWVPGRARVRALLTAGIAIAVGTPLLIIGTNPDFVILDHDPRVVGLLVALVGLIGLSIALLDGWLDRRLPHSVAGQRRPAALYAIVTLAGAVLVLPFALLVILTSDEYQLQLRAGYLLLVVGLCTAVWWGLRVRGHVRAPRGLEIVARVALLIAVMLGVLTSLPHIYRALGAPS
jgi:hypothetical protein